MGILSCCDAAWLRKVSPFRHGAYTAILFVLAVRTLVIRSSRVWRNAGGSCARLFCSHFENFSRHSERSLSSSALGGIQLRGCNCFFEVLLGRAATLPTWEHVPVDGTHVFVPTIAPLKCCLSLSAMKVTRGSTNCSRNEGLLSRGDGMLLVSAPF